MSRAGAGGSAPFLGLAEIAARFLVPAAAGLVIVSIVVGRGWAISLELHLIAPRELRAGEPLPLRAHVFGDLRRPEGPRLLQRPVTVELLDGADRALASTTLRPGHGGSMEGALQLPAAPPGGALWLRGRVGDDAGGWAAESRIMLRRQPAPAADAAPRALPPLRQLALGPISPVGASTPPSSLSLRVGGGACVPELPCELLVHVGEPAAHVRLEASPSVTPLPDGAEHAADVTGGVVRLRVRTHGPEAQTVLLAERDGAVVARRALRLPLDLSASAVELSGSRLPAGGQLVTGLASGQGGCIADVFARDRWLRTASVPSCAKVAIDADGLPAGALRVQLRRDVFDSATAAVRVFYLADLADLADTEGIADRELAELAQAVLVRDAGDVLARGLVAGAHVESSERGALTSYLLAAFEQDLVALPPAASSRPAAEARMTRQRARISRMALWLLSLCGLALALLLVLRGLTASAEAGRIMGDAGQEAPAIERQQLRMILRVAAVGLSILLAFGAIAMYVIARASGP